MTEREALQDLTTSHGWTLLKDHAQVELTTRLQLVLNRARGDATLEDLGMELRSHLKASDIVKALLNWPGDRADELERKEAR